MSRVIHFEIPASDPERASAFYKKVFGWKICTHCFGTAFLIYNHLLDAPAEEGLTEPSSFQLFYRLHLETALVSSDHPA